VNEVTIRSADRSVAHTLSGNRDRSNAAITATRAAGCDVDADTAVSAGETVVFDPTGGESTAAS